MTGIDRRHWIAGGIGGVGALLVTACNDGLTLPLPPPFVELPYPQDGQTRFSGTIDEKTAHLYAYNERSGLIFGEITEDQSFDFFAGAEPGDSFLFWSEVLGIESEKQRVWVPENPSDAGAQDAGL